jgi:DNA polymerase-3 subunit delta'
MLFGFNEIEQKLTNLYNANKLSHAFLLSGKKGIGKSSFAKEFVAKISQQKSAVNPDLLIIDKEEDKREITVDRIRKIADFANQTASNLRDKFIIIDSACELNRSAANALLKILEEPRSGNYLILIAHNLEKVIPTIRSRCQIVKVEDLSESDFHKILQSQNLAVSDDNLKFLADICDNSPALAINIGADLIRFYELFLRSILNKKISDELLKTVSDKAFNFVICEKIFTFFFSRLMKFLHGIAVEGKPDEIAVFGKIAERLSLKEVLVLNEKIANNLRKTAPLYLDKKLSFINAFNLMVNG